MRLINATTLKIHEFLNDARIPPYAILSHTWEKEECTLQQMEDPNASMVSKWKGYKKIKGCCEQALTDGLQWAWVDTCCIDKTSTAELSEAINSMFRWYRNANICYAYLSDIVEVAQLARSRWFTRGWTLQELLAPPTVWFYNSSWQYIGSKLELRQQLQHITDIEAEVLMTGNLDIVNVATKMSWAANRQTTRVEDLAYCLMGVFGVNMPLLYGEGGKSFIRLQQEIMKISDDQSLFAWGLPAKVKTMQEFINTSSVPDPRSPVFTQQMHGLFAESPSDFTFIDQIHVLEDPQSTIPPIVSNNGVRIELQVKRPSNTAIQFAVIYCTIKDRYTYYLGFPILPWGGRWVARCGELVAIAVTDLVTSKSETPYRKPSALLIKAPSSLPTVAPKHAVSFKLVQVPNDCQDYCRLEDVHCSAHATYSPNDQTITLLEDKNALHAVIFYVPGRSDPLDLFPRPEVDKERVIFDSMLADARPVKDSFVLIGKNRINKDTYSVTYPYVVTHPPFAILVGGVSKNLWMESVLILSDDDAVADFQRLHKASGELVRFCTTKGYLLSLLEQSIPIEPLCTRRYQQERQQIMHWTYSCMPLSLYLREGGLWVDTQLRKVLGNLVEHSLVLFVEILKERDGEKRKAQQPNWWGFDNDEIDLETKIAMY